MKRFWGPKEGPKACLYLISYDPEPSTSSLSQSTDRGLFLLFCCGVWEPWGTISGIITANPNKTSYKWHESHKVPWKKTLLTPHKSKGSGFDEFAYVLCTLWCCPGQGTGQSQLQTCFAHHPMVAVFPYIFSGSPLMVFGGLSYTYSSSVIAPEMGKYYHMPANTCSFTRFNPCPILWPITLFTLVAVAVPNLSHPLVVPK